MNNLNAAKIALMLFWEEKENDSLYLNYLLKFANCLLDKGN